MPNLAEGRGRQTNQSRITNNRDAVLPTRRDDRLPDAVVAADLRNAYRGNSVDETRRALGMVTDAVKDVARIGDINTALRAPGERAQGSLDAAGGAIADPALARPTAYQDAYYSSKAEADLTKWQADTGTQIQDMIDKGKSPEDVQEFVKHSVMAFRDEVGEHYPSSSAQHSLGVGLMRFASQLDVKVSAQFKERTDQELVNNAGFNLVNTLDLGEEHPSVTPTDTHSVSPAKFALPVNGRVTSTFGEGRATGRHNGVDLAAPEGSPVGSAAPGTVIAVGKDNRSGNFVKVKHPDGSTTSYSHLGHVAVKEGDSVDGGAKVGTVGMTGNTTGPHTHFVYRDANGHEQDPESLVGKSVGASVEATRARQVQTISAHFEDSLANLKAAGIDPKTAKAALVSSVVAWATDITDPHPEELLAFANSRRADGTPSLSPAERQEIQNAAVTAFGYQKRKENEDKKAAQDSVEEELYKGITSGKDVKATIDGAFRSGVFTAGEAMAWNTHARTEQERREKGQANEVLVRQIQLELLDPKADHEAVRERITGAYNSGELGTGTEAGTAFVSLMRAAKERRENKPSNSPEGQAARSYLQSTLKPETDDLRGNPAVAGLYYAANIELAKKIDGGADPMKAAQEVYDSFAPKLDQALKRRPAAPTQATNTPRPSQATPPPKDDAAALARVRQLAAERTRKQAELRR